MTPIFKMSNAGGMDATLNRYSDMLAGNTVYNPSSYYSIATQTVGSGGASSVTFSSIPSTYTHLQIRMFEFESTTGINPLIKFNGDTANNYSWHFIYGNGSSANGVSSASYGGLLMDQVQSTTYPNVAIIDILDYANTNKYKTARWLQGYDKNGSGQISFWSGNWRNTNAITSITISDPTFTSGTQFALYGVN